MRWVDAARSYGRAEEFLARWCAQRGIARDAVVVSSKWGYEYTAGWRVDAPVHEEKKLSLARFERQLGETRALLGDRLALYQIHSATAESGVLADAALLRALVAGRRRGDYRAIGLTLSGPTSAATLALAREARVDGEAVFDAVQATFNCLEPSLAAPLAAARAAGMLVLAKEVHANGRLTDANERPEDRALLAHLRAVAAPRGLAIDQLALAWAASHPFVDVVLSGAATVGQLASHVAALGVVLDDQGLAELATVAEPPAAYWATRAALPWS